METKLKDKCYPAIEGLRMLGEDYFMMARIEYLIDKGYSKMKKVMNKVVGIMRTFIESDM